MADRKGMNAEATKRAGQYEYRATSNLVLTADRTGLGRREDGAGEVESLAGRITKEKMGDRVQRGRPAELDDKLERLKRRKQKRANEAELPQNRVRRAADALAQTQDLQLYYQPKTRETKAVYERLLRQMTSCLGEQPADVMRGAADEVLAILKNDRLRDTERKAQVEEICNHLPDEQFSTLMQLSQQITDFTDEQDQADRAANDARDNQMGVAVVFDDDSEDEGSDLDEIGASDDEGSEEGEDTTMGGAVTAGGAVEESGMDVEESGINVHEIDAFWLQRKLATYYPDAHERQLKAEETFATLGASSGRECENKLVVLLDAYDKFDFIKLLLGNQAKIYWCMRLARAGSGSAEEERSAVESEMQQGAESAAILEQLNRTATKKDKDRALEERVRKEVRDINKTQQGGGAEAMATDSAFSAGGSSANLTAQALAPRSMLDLDELAFDGGSHVNSNPKVSLPEGSYRTEKKGYEEVHIPSSSQPKGDDEILVPIKELPSWTHSAFKGMKELNRIQSKVYDTAFKSPENILMCAPTGAGKTNVALLAILHEIGKHRDAETGEIDLNAFKIVYVAPMKALVQEIVGNFGQRLADMGITVNELSGDQSLTKEQIANTQIIVTTPEKWDIVTRKSGDRTYTQLVRLVLIDEVHLLHDTRGPVLENIVGRLFRQIETTRQLVRLVALSATLPNYEDVATFLRVKKDKGLFFFDGSFRPVPLKQQYIGIKEKKAIKRFQLMNEVCYEKVMEEAVHSQVIVFVHARKETARTAKALRDMALESGDITKLLKEGSGSREVLEQEAESFKNLDCQDIVPHSFGIHHAGMNKVDRKLVEDLFSDGHIKVLVSTSTLAWGVNLPAHTVIIKGTQVYSPEEGRWVELSMMDIMQMLGRAGRPQYDSFGHGIVITNHSELPYYLSLMNEQLPVESQFVQRLPDWLNADIVMGAVRSISDAVNWLGYTYLYVRMLRNPGLYHVTRADMEADPLLEQRRLDLAHTAACVLDKANLCKYDRKTGALAPTDLGRVASHYYMTHTTMSCFNAHLKPTTGDIELFRLFSLSDEFKFINVREEEKLELEKLAARVPVPVKEGIEEPSAKVNVLLQAYISRMKLDGFALMSDMIFITQSAGRIMRALFEIVLRRGWSALALRCLELSKMIQRRMWPSQTSLRQFKGVPDAILKKIEKIDFPWEQLYDLSAPEIGELVRFPKMGKTLHRQVHQFPRLELSAHVMPLTRSTLRVELSITADFDMVEKVHGHVEPFWVVVEDVDSENILHSEYFALKRQFKDDETVMYFTVPVFEPLPPQYFVRVVSDRWLGCSTVLPVSFRHLILPEKFAPHTELHDLAPKPVSDLPNAEWKGLFPFSHFNPLQTQSFPALCDGDTHVLLAAPSGSGKTVCAELAILRMLQTGGGAAVYVAPLAAMCRARFAEWSEKFGKIGVSVSLLRGETQADLRALKTAQPGIVIAEAAHWDMLSRRWKQRKDVQNVRLFVVDELHLLSSEHGPVLEVVTSRMRYIAAQTEKPLRIVGLAASVANGKDIGEWIGAPKASTFSFHPSVRPTPLEIHIQGFEQQSFNARMLAMARPAYTAISRRAQTDPDDASCVVFVGSKKAARTLAADLLTYAGADNMPERFLLVEPNDIAPYVEQMNGAVQKQLLSRGVALLHEGLTQPERAAVLKLFESGAVSLMITTNTMTWETSVGCGLVVIAGTQHYSSRDHRYAEYPLAEVHQMMARAARPRLGEEKARSGGCVVLCHSPQKEFYMKFLFEPLPVESHLDQYLHDHLNAEIMTRTIENKQDAVDYLTWTFFYRRLSQNPNYYSMTGTTHRHLSDFLSETIESTLGELQQSQCISIEEDMDVSSLNIGMIASYYYIRYTTIELFAGAVTEKANLQKILTILVSAVEFEELPSRQGEDNLLRKLANHLPLRVPNVKFTDPHTKAHVLLQSHFSRTPLTADLRDDLHVVLELSSRLLMAMVDVISSTGWMTPALATMELSQMVTQGLWSEDSALMQLPHVTKELAGAAAKAEVDGVFELLEMEDAERAAVLPLTPRQMSDVARVCNRYPSVECSHEVADADDIFTGDPVVLEVSLEREMPDESGKLGPVYAPLYPKPKDEGWWLVVGNPSANELKAIKRVTFGADATAKLEFDAPEKAGDYTWELSLMCDSWMGCDQEFEVSFSVAEDEDESGEEGGADEGGAGAMDEDAGDDESKRQNTE